MKNIDETKQAFHQVEGPYGWWIKELDIGSDNRIIRKNFDYSETIRPWLLPVTPNFCQQSKGALSIQIPTTDENGNSLDQYYVLIFVLDIDQVDHDFIYSSDSSNNVNISSRKLKSLVRNLKANAEKIYASFYTRPGN